MWRVFWKYWNYCTNCEHYHKHWHGCKPDMEAMFHDVVQYLHWWPVSKDPNFNLKIHFVPVPDKQRFLKCERLEKATVDPFFMYFTLDCQRWTMAYYDLASMSALRLLQTMSEAGRMWLSSFTGQEEDNIQILPLKLSPTLGQWCGQIITSVYIYM